jgi:hypothetical protein
VAPGGAGLPEIIIADFAEVAKLHVFGIGNHLPDYFLERAHIIIVSLLPPLFKAYEAKHGKYPEQTMLIKASF